MPKRLSISAQVVHHGSDYVPSLLANRSPLCLDLAVEPAGALPPEARLVVKARELFSDARQEWTGPIDAAQADGEGTLHLDLDARDLPLSPGCWHVLVDLTDADGRSLAGKDVGSVEVYARRPEESTLHARGSYNIARSEFAWDPAYGIYYSSYNPLIPPTGDPFDPADHERHRRRFVTRESTWPELQHDGGLGFLMSACVFRALGEDKRASLCEKVMRRTAGAITGVMYAGEGRLEAVDDVDKDRAHLGHCKQQDGFALKFLAQTAMYFRHGPGSDEGFADEVMEKARPIFEYQIAQPLEPGCGECGCMVYDGRILAGLAWYCLAVRAATGEYPGAGADPMVQRFAQLLARQCLANRGWYDAGCLTEGECHTWCGNMNLLNGLLPVRRMLKDRLPAEGFRLFWPHIQAGIDDAFEFLGRTSGSVTGRMPFVPSRTSKWAAGNMFEICDEYLRQVRPDPSVEQIRKHLVHNSGSGIIECFHRNNTTGAVMMSCPEYQALAPRPPLPWDRAFVAEPPL